MLSVAPPTVNVTAWFATGLPALSVTVPDADGLSVTNANIHELKTVSQYTCTSVGPVYPNAGPPTVTLADCEDPVTCVDVDVSVHLQAACDL